MGIFDKLFNRKPNGNVLPPEDDRQVAKGHLEQKDTAQATKESATLQVREVEVKTEVKPETNAEINAEEKHDKQIIQTDESAIQFDDSTQTSFQNQTTMDSKE
jgi:hypothetical protein